MATSKESAVSDIPGLVDRYIAAWNEREPGRRRELVVETFADGASGGTDLATVAPDGRLQAVTGFSDRVG
jgi:hypothetical protein